MGAWEGEGLNYRVHCANKKGLNQNLAGIDTINKVVKNCILFNIVITKWQTTDISSAKTEMNVCNHKAHLAWPSGNSPNTGPHVK